MRHGIDRRSGAFVAASVLVASALRAQATAVDFATEVLPILQQRCFACHRGVDDQGRPRRPKAGLRLDGAGWIRRGSDEHRVVVPGDAAQSLLYTRTVLPADDEQRMPGRGEPLTPATTETLRRWINAGADFGEWTGQPGPETTVPDEVAGQPRELALLEELERGVAAVSPSVVASGTWRRARVTAAQPGSPLLRVEFALATPEVAAADLRALGPIADHIAYLHLGRTAITDSSLAAVANMRRLVRLDLQHTAITDGGLRRLVGSPQLRSLNLFGTKVTDAGLTTLRELPVLECVYLGGTAVTAVGLAALRHDLPKTVVLGAPELPDPPVDPEPRAAPRRR